MQYTAVADASCTNRQYGLKSFPSAEEADSAGAVVTHGGPCGVCSDMEDFTMRMMNGDDFQTTAVLCAVSYTLDRNFNELIACYQDKLGLTEECGKLWAHYSATNAGLCADACASNVNNEGNLTGPPPECALSECLQCSNSTFQADFNLLSGGTWAHSGITERIARPCNDFFPVDHDPCAGNATIVAPNRTMPPTTEPTSGGKSGMSARIPVAAALLAFLIVGWV